MTGPRNALAAPALQAAALATLLLSGAIFGFFYAWVCSTMWGLDAADPRVAIAAMQAMNASVRNAVFFPAFFLTPAVAAATALLAWSIGRRAAAVWLAAAAAIYLLGAFAPTALVNVPMNRALGALAVPGSVEEAARIWQAYSGPWQAWNIARTCASALALGCAGVALTRLRAAG